MTVGKKFLSFLLVVCVAAGLLSPAPSLTAEAASKTNQKIIFRYLTETMKLPPAAACGVLANIERESDFNPHATGDSGTSYGICQWHKTRFTALKRYCKKYKMDYRTITGQLKYLRYELKTSYPGVLRFLKHVSNDPYGAYQAGYYWCYHFERPAKYLTGSVTRGNLAKSRYWKKFGAATVSYDDIEEQEDTVTPAHVSGLSIPAVITAGERLAFEGTVASPSEIRKVTAGFYHIDENAVIVKSVDPSGKSCELADVSKMISSEKLEPGVYLFILTVQNAAGTEQVAAQNITVLARTGELDSGNYEIAPSMNKNLMLAPDPSGSGVLALTDDVKAESAHFQFVRFTNGYYSVRSISENRYLTLEPDGRLHLARWEASDGQFWQFVNGSGILNCLIPKSHTDRCLTIRDALEKNAGITVSDTVQNELQFVRLFEADDDSPLLKPEVKTDNSLYLEVPKTALTVTYGDGRMNLRADSNGQLTYSCSVPDIASIDEEGNVTAVGYGKTVITITAAKPGFNDKTVRIAYKVIPAKAKLTSVKSHYKKRVLVKWNADLLSNGYDLQVSLSKSFKKASTATYTTKHRNKASAVIKKLTSRKTYYFRIRAYKMVNGKKLAGAWSKTLNATVK